MQTILCLITFLISTSRLTSAYTYLGIACTSALRLGLHKDVGMDYAYPETQQEARMRIMLAVLQLDTFVSIVLDMPARINRDCIDPGVLAALQPQPTKKVLATEFASEPHTKFAASTKLQHILMLTASGLQGIFPRGNNQDKRSTGPDIHGVNLTKMNEIEDALRKWAKTLLAVPLVAGKTEMSAM
jgi:hypothetical protein